MSRITDYAALAAPAADDVLPVVDIHDTSMAATGTTKKVTIASLVPDLDIVSAAPGTLAGWNYPAWGISGSAAPTQTAGSNGALYFLKFRLPYARTVSALHFWVATGGSGAAVAGAFSGITDAAGAVVASTVNRAADSALVTASSDWAPPLVTPLAAAAGTDYYALLLMWMAGGGINPSLGCMNSGRAGNAGQSAGSFPVAQLPAQTSVGGPYALASLTVTNLWFQVSLS